MPLITRLLKCNDDMKARGTTIMEWTNDYPMMDPWILHNWHDAGSCRGTWRNYITLLQSWFGYFNHVRSGRSSVLLHTILLLL